MLDVGARVPISAVARFNHALAENGFGSSPQDRLSP
jgi:hypothetical protein